MTRGIHRLTLRIPAEMFDALDAESRSLEGRLGGRTAPVRGEGSSMNAMIIKCIKGHICKACGENLGVYCVECLQAAFMRGMERQKEINDG